MSDSLKPFETVAVAEEPVEAEKKPSKKKKAIPETPRVEPPSGGRLYHGFWRKR